MTKKEECQKKIKYLENQIGLLNPELGKSDYKMLRAAGKIARALSDVLECHFELGR